ncbi:HtaA domain-containing protein [Streptomyces sp. NPDC048636]|uniref:HtaA domain-containing protein n=1 Tax=Streptomyces sp. NPDC048636 TaxID=3155762 RepID=UPI00342786A4
MPSFKPVRGSAVGAVPVLCAALLSGVLPGGPPVPEAHAADRTVAGGRLDWGIKSSFQSYVTGPVARGGWSLRDGAATVGGSQFRFHSATGAYDPDSGAFRAGFSGGVRFTGHRKADGTYELDLTISRPTVRVAGGSGTLYADLSSKAKGTGTVTRSTQVPLASLDLRGVNVRGGGSPVTLTHLPATLTARGAKAFAGYYTAGTALDPVSLSADVAGAKPTPGASKSPGSSGAGEGAGREKRGTFREAAVDWGVRRTFREYVTGPIAKGEWRLSDGAQDGGALFRFPHGKGEYDERKGTLRADFQGRLRFRGTKLDLTLSGVSVRIADGRGTLSAEVVNRRATDRDVPLATFEVTRLRPKNGLITVVEAPAELTGRGAGAFGGLYKAGTAMDPVSLAVAVDGEAALPPLPDLGSEPSAAAPEPTGTDRAEPGGSPKAASSSGGSHSSTVAWAAGAGGGVLVAAAVAFAVLRRRRAVSSVSSSSDSDQEAP